MATSAPVSLVTHLQYRYIALLCSDHDPEHYLGDRYLAMEVRGGVPYLSFKEKEITRLAVHEVVYMDANIMKMKGVVMIRAPNGCFWERNIACTSEDASSLKGDNRYVRADRKTVPSAADTACLFRIFRVLNSNAITFQSLVDYAYLKRYQLPQNIPHAFHASTSIPDDRFAKVSVTNAAAFAVTIPRYIMLFGYDERYLCHRTLDNYPKFAKRTPQLDVDAVQEVTLLLDGNVMFGNVKGNMFWKQQSPTLDRSSGRIVARQASLSDARQDKDCHFDVIRLSSTMVAIKSIKNGLFLAYRPNAGDWLSAAGSSIDEGGTHLVVREALLRRSLCNIKYLLDLAEVSEMTTATIGSGSVRNKTNFATACQVHVNVTRQITTLESWSESTPCNFSSGVPVEFTAGVPVVAATGQLYGSLDSSVKVVLSPPTTISTEMGKTLQTNVPFQSVYEVGNVPSGVEVNVTVLCTTAKCYVPFTYTSKDTRLDGIELPQVDHVDGTFEGVNVLDIKAIITQVLDSPTML